MATQTITSSAAAEEVSSVSFERAAGMCAILAGVSGLLYSVAFVVIKEASLYSLSLMLGGIFTTVALVGLYSRLRETDAAFAIWGLVVALAAAIGSVIHGGYDLALSVHPPASPNVDLPSQIDPRGLLTFGLSGLAMFVLAWLVTRSIHFPKALGYLGYLLAVLLVVVYLGRLIVLDAGSYAILLPAALAGFIVNPAWYVWLGLTLWRGNRSA